MVGIIRIIIISKMAAYACCGQTVVLPTRMALVATGLHMLSGQREVRVVVVKHRFPVRGCMTRLTRRREVRRFVIRLGRAVVVGKVTAYTRRRQAIILPTRVALVATGLHMLTC